MEAETVEGVESTESPASFETALNEDKATVEIPEPQEPATEAPAPEAAPEVLPDAPKEEPQPDPRAQELEDLKANGLLKALTSERRKRQALEEQLAQFNQGLQSQPYVPETYDPTPQVDPSNARIKAQLLAMNETQAKSVYPDYTEKINVFSSEALTNPALYESVFDSDSPAFAAYEAGKEIIFRKKYGTSIDQIVEGVRKETRSQMRKEILAEVQQEMTGKIAARANVPTNISAVGGRAGSPTEDFAPSSFATMLGSKRRR